MAKGWGSNGGDLCGHWLQRQCNLAGGICKLRSNNIYLWRYEIVGQRWHGFMIVRIGDRDLFGVGWGLKVARKMSNGSSANNTFVYLRLCP